MSRGVFLRVAFVLPPFVAIAVISAYMLISNPVGAGPDGFWTQAAGIVLLVAVYGFFLGVWPGYIVWALGYLWVTRRLSAARFRATSYWAPLTFAPVCALAWVASGVVGDGQVNVSLGALGTVLVAALVVGYVTVTLVLVLEWLFARFGWLKTPAPAAAART
jgi:hypothetical protein